MEIWHNPRCGKSRAAKAALDDAAPGHTERRYLDEPPTAAELDAVLTKLGREPWEITRFKEARAGELDVANLPRERAKWIAVLVANPVLIERPIIIDDTRAYLARTPEAIAEALGR
ncbi:MAG: arsenate reductase family protein [Actinomycetota bacterium]|nr:arsenate reductase family protein [Actinomycetota bacterium]